MDKYLGSCHCGAVSFEVEVEPGLTIYHCNCSICQQTGFLHWIVPRAQFHLLKGQDKLTLYQFNSKVAKHYFCKTCGVKSFYIPRSNPDGVSVNANCLQLDLGNFEIKPFDGQNWQRSASQLSHLSKTPNSKG